MFEFVDHNESISAGEFIFSDGGDSDVAVIIQPPSTSKPAAIPSRKRKHVMNIESDTTDDDLEFVPVDNNDDDDDDDNARYTQKIMRKKRTPAKKIIN